MTSQNQLISVVIPVFNEEEVLPLTLDRVLKVINDLNYEFEMILVDNFSEDNTWEIVQEKSESKNLIRGLRLSRNFGVQSSITAGLSEADGDAVILIDADLQNPPELIPKFLDKWDEGYDVVYGTYDTSSENVLKRFTSWLFYKVSNKLMYIQIPDNTAEFSLLSRPVVDAFNQLNESHQFIRGLRSWVGFKQTGVSYEKPERAQGESNFSYFELLRLALDGMISFSILPLRLILSLGLIISFLGFSYNGFVVLMKIFYETPQGWASLVSIDLIMGGFQLIVLGIIGEYVGRIYQEVKQRPNYIVRDRTQE